jgi:hypothetical protein
VQHHVLVKQLHSFHVAAVSLFIPHTCEAHKQRVTHVHVALCAACLHATAAAGALSIVEVGSKRVKLAAGAYVGTLEAPEQMAVFLYYLDVSHCCSNTPNDSSLCAVMLEITDGYVADVVMSLIALQSPLTG